VNGIGPRSAERRGKSAGKLPRRKRNTDNISVRKAGEKGNSLILLAYRKKQHTWGIF